MILHGSEKNHLFGWGASGQANASRDQPGGLADLRGLGEPLGAELIKQPARMGLHRVFADEQPPGNLPIAQPIGTV